MNSNKKNSNIINFKTLYNTIKKDKDDPLSDIKNNFTISELRRRDSELSEKTSILKTDLGKTLKKHNSER